MVKQYENETLWDTSKPFFGDKSKALKTIEGIQHKNEKFIEETIKSFPVDQIPKEIEDQLNNCLISLNVKATRKIMDKPVIELDALAQKKELNNEFYLKTDYTTPVNRGWNN